MGSKHEILMAGSGGQGLVFLASFLAEAAIVEGLNVVQTQSYGIAQRGGFISAEVITDTAEILYHQVVTPDIIIALHDCVGSRYDNQKCNVIYDSSLIHNITAKNWFGFPFTKIANEIGAPKAANLIALGVMASMLPVISADSLAKVATRKFKPNIAELNIKAITCGIDAAKQSTL